MRAMRLNLIHKLRSLWPTKAAAPAAPADVPPPVVLIVEDEPSILKLLRLVLVRFGFRVHGFTCGDDVLVAPRELLMSARYALVDDAFPGNLTGPQTVVVLHCINPEMKIFPMAGRDFQGWELELMESHYRQLLPKPFTADGLLQTLKEAPVTPVL